MQAGSENIIRQANTIVSKEIAFPKPFKKTPQIFVCGYSASVKNFSFSASNTSQNGFTVYCYSEVSGGMGFGWLAIESK